MSKPIYPCLWFDNNAAEAANFYFSIFRDTKITSSNSIVTMIEIEGEKMMLLNGGPMFVKNPSVSFYVTCSTEEEVNELWGKLSEGGMSLMPVDSYPWSKRYGWIQDKFGVNWQLTFGDPDEIKQKVVPVMMFTGEVAGKTEDAMNFYGSLIKPFSIEVLAKYEEGEIDHPGTIKHGRFRIDENVMIAMDSHYPHNFSFNEGVSFVLECKDQKEIDFYWDSFTKDGSESMCGWCKDRYGVSWQVVPEVLKELMSEPEKAGKVTAAFMKMKKLNIDELTSA